jgi:hypothetical protein
MRKKSVGKMSFMKKKTIDSFVKKEDKKKREKTILYKISQILKQKKSCVKAKKIEGN